MSTFLKISTMVNCPHFLKISEVFQRFNETQEYEDQNLDMMSSEFFHLVYQTSQNIEL